MRVDGSERKKHYLEATFRQNPLVRNTLLPLSPGRGGWGAYNARVLQAKDRKCKPLQELAMVAWE